MYLIFNIIIQHPLPKVDSGPGIRQISANMKLFDRSEMLPRNLHFKTSAPDDSNAGGLSPTLRNPGHKTHRYHRNGEK